MGLCAPCRESPERRAAAEKQVRRVLEEAALVGGGGGGLAVPDPEILVFPGEEH